MMKEKTLLIDRYLAGDAPLHPEYLVPPGDEELNEAEIAFDQLMAERQHNITIVRKARIISLWPWTAAACFLVTIGIVLWTLLPQDKQPEQRQQRTVVESVSSIQSSLPHPAEQPKQAALTKSNLHKKTVKSATSQQQPKQATPTSPLADMPEIDLAAEVADILANIDQLEQQILVTNPQNNN